MVYSISGILPLVLVYASFFGACTHTWANAWGGRGAEHAVEEDRLGVGLWQVVAAPPPPQHQGQVIWFFRTMYDVVFRLNSWNLTLNL